MYIGILTYHAPANFGANLQAYTSYRYFTSLGYQVKIINYQSADDLKKDYCDPKQVEGHNRFINEVLPVTKLVYSGEEIYELVKSEGFEIIAVGSDAVWNNPSYERLSVFFCKWLLGTELEHKIKVIALSPAFMGASYNELSLEQKDEFKKGLLNFSSINARDEWTRSVINTEILGADYIKITNPDPVFNLNDYCNENWKNENPNIKPNNYFILSLSSGIEHSSHSYMQRRKENWIKELKEYLNNKGYFLVELPIPDGVSGFKDFDYIVPYPIDPLQWYLWIKNAKGFIGLRFHAIISCISAGTPFYSVDAYGHLPTYYKRLAFWGIHPFDAQFNKSSKIRNLLNGSGFEKYRISGANSIFGVRPQKLANMLFNFDNKQLASFKKTTVETFSRNMMDALAKCESHE